MDEGFLVDNYQEADLYQDLTLFIKIFKKIMDLAEKMVESIQREESNVDLISEMKEIPDEANSLISKYHYQLKEDSVHKNTFYRFMCRLNQTIEIYKNRANTKYANSGHFAQFLERVEQTVMSYTLDKNIGRIFKKIMHFTTKICQFCQAANNSPTQQVAQTLFRETSQEKNIESQLTKNKFHYNSSESNFHKAMNVLNKRFNSLGCLDIDYNCFKMSFFHARNQKKQFFNQYFQRNIYIWREISSYSKEFQEYLKKRAKIILNRKNRFKERPQKTDSTKRQSNSKDIDEIRSVSSNYFIKDKSKRVSKNQHLPILREASLQIEQSQGDGSKNDEKDLDKMLDLQYRDIEVERRKTNYQLKNVYLTLNKVIPTTTNVNSQMRKNLNKINKDKLKMYGALKKGKLSLRTTKYAQSQKIVNKPVLEVKPIETAFFGFTMNHSMIEALQRQKVDILQNKSLQISKDGVLFKALAEKQNMRKGQLFLSHKVSFETQKTEKNEVFGPETAQVTMLRNQKSIIKG